METPASQRRCRIRFSLVVDSVARETISGPWGAVKTPAELDVHISCEQSGPDGTWSAWVGTAILKGARVGVPKSLGREGRHGRPPLHRDAMSAAAAVYRDALAYAWPDKGK